jgi:hypothetical protein
VKLLFVLRHALYLRNYESVIRELASQGHEVVLAFTPIKKFINPALLDDLLKDYPNVTVEWLPARSGRYTQMADGARRLADYLRYLAPEFKRAPRLRERAGSPLPRGVRQIFNVPWFGTLVLRKIAEAVIQLMERAWPIDAAARKFLARVDPDVFLVSPLLDLTYNQQEYLKAARLAGIPSALLVASWDNLTNKGLIQVRPDAVMLWNEFQKDEAVRLHGIDPSRVIVTGAQLYDHWFDMKPSTTFDDFCRTVGLDPGRPIISYMCSSTFIAREEIAFVREWIAAIRAHRDQKVSSANILIRPYPGNPGAWAEFDSSRPEGVVVWPPDGAHPIDDSSKSEYFDCLYHSAAVVGVNTSAFLEAGILMRPVLTVRDPRFFETQDGTLHFHHLLMDGFLASSESLSAHVDALVALLSGETSYLERNQRFVGKFLRPLGPDILPTQQVVSSVLQLGGRQAAPYKRSILAPIVLALLYPFTVLLERSTKLGKPKKAKKQKLPKRTGADVSYNPRVPSAGAFPWIGKGLRFSAKAYLKIITLTGQRTNFRLYGLPVFLRSYNIADAGPSRDKIEKRVLEMGAVPDSPGGKLVKAPVPESAAFKKAIKKKAVELANSVPSVLSNLANTQKMILVGPWLSEVGFETLYWIPFLNWAKRTYGLPSERFVVVSRGGVADWYKDLGYADYIDAFEFFTPSEFKGRTEERWKEIGGLQKQMHMSSFDNDLIERATAKLGLKRDEVEVLHPSLMYAFNRSYWRGAVSVEEFLQTADFRSWNTDEKHDVLAHLPARYAAVRFYFRPSFPDTPQNRQFARSIISAVSRTLPVVVLNPNFQVDDHEDFDDTGEVRVISIDRFMTPENNLGVQSAVISNAELFVGTYGGLSYVAPLYGVPALAFHSDRSEFLGSHLETAYAAFQLLAEEQGAAADSDDPKAPLFTVLGVSDAQPIIQLLAADGQPGVGKSSKADAKARSTARPEAQVGAPN